METFAYAHPTTKQQALGLLGPSWEDAAVLAGGTDMISLMKEHVVIPKRVVSIRGIQEWSGISADPAACASARWPPFRRFARSRRGPEAISCVLDHRRGGHFQPANSQYGHHWRRSCASGRAAGISATGSACSRVIRERQFAGARTAKIAITPSLAMMAPRIS